MTELDLYKFINERDVEYHWDDKNNVWMFVYYPELYDFNKMLGNNITDEDGIDCVMKDGYICFEMTGICACFGIDPENVFTNKD